MRLADGSVDRPVGALKRSEDSSSSETLEVLNGTSIKGKSEAIVVEPVMSALDSAIGGVIPSRVEEVGLTFLRFFKTNLSGY
jgi:hypothetical protein